MSTAPAKIGHNSNVDFDMATDFVDVGPLSGRKDLDANQLSNFRHAIRTQGNNNIRQRAITNMLERARANAALSHVGYRILERIAQRCRGGFRYTIEPQDTLGFFCGVSHRQNISRALPDIIDLGFVVGIDVPSRTGGRPRRFYTVVCTGGDRTGTSSTDLAFEARRRNLELMDDAAATKLANAIIGEIEAKKQTEAMHQGGALVVEIEQAKNHSDALLEPKHQSDALPKHQNDALPEASKNNGLKKPKHQNDALDALMHVQGTKHQNDDVSIVDYSLRDSPLTPEIVERGVWGESASSGDQLAPPEASPPKLTPTTETGAQKAKRSVIEFDLQPIDVVEIEVLSPGEGFGAGGALRKQGPGAAPPSERKKPLRSFPKSEDEVKRLWTYCIKYGISHGMTEEIAKAEARHWKDWAESKGKQFSSWDAAWRTWVSNWSKRKYQPGGSAPQSRAEVIDEAIAETLKNWK